MFFCYCYCHHGVQPVSTLSLGGRETGGTGRLHIRFTMLPSDETELFICRISQQQCLKCRGEIALVLVSNVHDRCLGPETGHTALLCSVLLPDQPGSVPDALAQAAVSAAPVALLWLSSLCCITVAGLTKQESGWSCLVCCRGSDIFLGAQDPQRLVHEASSMSCATFHSLKLHPMHQGAVCCGWHSEYCSAERQSLQFRACFVKQSCTEETNCSIQEIRS